MRYFFDTEFIERGHQHPIRLLSIGIVAEDGRELYLESPFAARLIELDYERWGDPWLIQNVHPHLLPFTTNNAIDGSRIFAMFAETLRVWCDPDHHGKPEFWAYYADYDWVVLCQLFGSMIDLPKGWPMYCRDLKQVVDMFPTTIGQLPPQNRAGETPEHHALCDARWTRRAWQEVKWKLGSTCFQGIDI